MKFIRYVPDSESATKLGYAYLFDGTFTVDVYSHVPGVSPAEVIALAHRLEANADLVAAVERAILEIRTTHIHEQPIGSATVSAVSLVMLEMALAKARGEADT